MDADGYPSEEELKVIETWNPQDFHGMMQYVYELWKYNDCGYWSQESGQYSISTGGWSGNESIIWAMQSNWIWWMLYWESSKRGGHYTFSSVTERYKTV